MLFFDIFGSLPRGIAMLSVYGALLYAVWLNRRLKIGLGLGFLALALICIFITSILQNFSLLDYDGFVSVTVLMLTEMLLVISSAVLLLTAASWILFNKSLNIPTVFAFVSVGLLLVIYAIFIANDANILISIRQLLPVIGMGCVSLSFISRPGILRNGPYLVTGIVCAGFIGLMIWPMYAASAYVWYLPLILISLLAFALCLIYVKDLTERLAQSSEKQRRTARNIENIVKSSPFPIIISRLSDDQLILANRNAVKLFALNEAEIARYHFKDFFIDADNRKLLLEQLEKKQQVQEFEILVKSAAGNTPFWLLMSANAMDYDNDVVLYAAFQDITDRKRRENILQTQADRDPLTSIYNRRYFEAHTAEKIMEARRHKKPFAIMMLDADHFKRINDTYGHKSGDKVLIELAAVCQRTLRADDLIARYGGEEFIIFLENVEADTAMLVANRLREAIAAGCVYAENGDPIRFTVSIGVVPSGISDNTDSLIKMADDAMYLAKEKGRNRVEQYNAEEIEKAKKSQIRQHDQSSRIHPVYLTEDDQEISLLDGIESKHMIED